MKRSVAMVVKLGALVALASLLLLDVSCGGPGRKLRGTWTSNTGCGNVTVTFNKDGTGSMSVMGQQEQFKWRVEQEQLVISKPDGSQEERHKYSFNDQGNLVIESDMGPIVFSKVK